MIKPQISYQDFEKVDIRIDPFSSEVLTLGVQDGIDDESN